MPSFTPKNHPPSQPSQHQHLHRIQLLLRRLLPLLRNLRVVDRRLQPASNLVRVLALVLVFGAVVGLVGHAGEDFFGVLF